MVEGAVQVPPDGQPIVMLADHPVTGGYPVIAVVDPRDLGHLSQMPAGSTVRFAAHSGRARFPPRPHDRAAHG
jgi:allophanate hydrolase subunit 2